MQPPRQQDIDTRLATGTHVTFVLIAPTTTRNADYIEAVRRAKIAVREWAGRVGNMYSTVGVSDAWQPTSALEDLGKFGAFDELIVGRNWFNAGVTKYISDTDAVAGVPQVVVVRQHIRVDTIPFQYGRAEELIRVVGYR